MDNAQIGATIVALIIRIVADFQTEYENKMGYFHQ
jgi:hypothetical protein